MFPQLRLEVFDGLELAELLGEIIVQLGMNLSLDGFNFDIIGDGFTGETLFVEVCGIADFKLELLAGFDPRSASLKAGRVFWPPTSTMTSIALDRLRLRLLGCFDLHP